ncbi:hypothetical protein ACFV9W_25955 [Streptomyces sp. NPDC059897]|uniref:hypothetical protein n=1 Tax=Streptomyces sp. NPDC059897 TaxID=3346994 RepID=UPI0036553B32
MRDGPTLFREQSPLTGARPERTPARSTPSTGYTTRRDAIIMRAGPLRVPSRPGLALEFLEEEWSTIQHYGVQVNHLRYNGPGLEGLYDQHSPYRGRHPGKWPIAVDRDDIRRVYFQHPKTHKWHALIWEHAADLNGPASLEALQYARRIAARTHRFPDTKSALIELLDRWGVGLAADRAERRMAVRLSQQRFRIVGDDLADQVADLPTVTRVTALHFDAHDPVAEEAPWPPVSGDPALQEVPGGDDDAEDECGAGLPGASTKEDDFDEEDFYEGAWETR